MAVRIFLADDHNMMRAGLRSLLESHADYQVVGEADTGRGAVDGATRLQPDVLVMDITMPDLNGIEATRQITAAAPGVRVAALSMHADRQFVTEMLKAGAKAYLLKTSAASELNQAIDALMAGDAYLSPKIANTVVQGYVRASAPDLENVIAPVPLTSRERQVLQLLAEGKSNKELAREMDLSVKTVETHRASIMEKLNLHSVAELTKYAIRHGMTGVE